MSKPELLGWVVYRMYRGAQLNMVRALLVRTPNGRHWAYPEESDPDQEPSAVGALSLDASDLEQQPDTPEGEHAYTYRTILHAPQ